MSKPIWQTTKQAGVPCATCGKIGSCKVSPDGTAFLCWRDGERVHQTKPHTGNGYTGNAHRKPAAATSANDRPATTYPTADAAMAAVGRVVRGGTRTAVYIYPSDAMRVCRFDTADGKQFRPIHQTATGWRIGDPPGPLPLYRLNELPAMGTIFVCEGEKATDVAAGLGLPTVASAHGSSAASKTDWTPLAGRDVVVLPDNDEPGEKYARDVATILANLDPPSRVKIIKLPGLPVGGDIVEYIDFRDSMESEAIAASIVYLADAVPFVQISKLIAGPVVICAADIVPTVVIWTWKGRIPRKRITLISGRPGCGKSMIICDMAARITTGTPWPDGELCERGSVLLISGEDDPDDTIVPRLIEHHADLSRVHILTMVRWMDDDGKPHETMFSLENLPALEMALNQNPDISTIVIDPAGSYIGGGTDSHRDNEVRAVLAPVAALAAKYNVAVVIVAHTRKSGGTSADDLVMGSRAFTGLARAVWHLSADPDNEDRRLLLPGKNNLARRGTGLAFTIIGDPPSVCWEREPVDMSADQALAIANAGGSIDAGKPGPAPKARNAAADWLAALLAIGEVDAGKVRDEIKAAGMNYRTVLRAADEIGVVRDRNEFSKSWQWRLPKAGGEPVDKSDDKFPVKENNLSTCQRPENQWKTDDSRCQDTPVDTLTSSKGLDPDARPGDDEPDDENPILTRGAMRKIRTSKAAVDAITGGKQ